MIEDCRENEGRSHPCTREDPRRDGNPTTGRLIPPCPIVLVVIRNGTDGVCGMKPANSIILPVPVRKGDGPDLFQGDGQTTVMCSIIILLLLSWCINHKAYYGRGKGVGLERGGEGGVWYR